MFNNLRRKKMQGTMPPDNPLSVAGVPMLRFGTPENSSSADPVVAKNWLSRSPMISKTRTSILVSLAMETNGMTFYLNSRLENVVSIRVKSIAWANRPSTLASATMLYLSNYELLQHSSAQSQILTPGSAIGNPTVNRRALIGSWVVAPTLSNVPNPGNNDPQGKIELACITSTDKLSFVLEDDGGPGNGLQRTNILSTDHVTLVLELEQII